MEKLALKLVVFSALVAFASAAVSRIIVCEWARPDGRKLSCPDGHVVDILTALYGRKSTSVCAHGYHRGVKNCGSDSGSLKKAEQLCNGKRECYLRSSNAMFGDPCWGINKYLDVSYTCVDMRIKEELIPPYVGTWTVAYSNRHKDSYTITSDGKISLKSSGRSVHLEESDNQAVFPSSKGWYKVNKLFRDKAWEYVRLNDDGTMEVEHFCTDGCRGRYANKLNNYCCKGNGFHIAAEGRPTRTYNINVKTSNIKYAGTSANAYIVIFGEKGDTGKLFFGKRTFAVKSSHNFAMKAMDVGKITMMKLGHDATGSGEGWHVDEVSVKVDTCTSTFSVWSWIYAKRRSVDVYPTLEQGKCPESDDKTEYVAYKVSVKTTNIKYGGTWGNALITLYGKKGETQALPFRDVFYQGTTRTTTFETKDVGKISHIKIRNDNSDAWHIDSISITAGSCVTAFTHKQWFYGKGKQIELKPASQTGECEKVPVTTGSICRRDFKKVGCFERDWSKMTDLLITDLDPTHKNFTKHMNWADYAEGLHSLACRCRAKAVGHYKYFGIGFMGECVAGKDEKGLEAMFKARSDGEGCINGLMETCKKGNHLECVGNMDFDFFYQIV